MSEKYVVKIDDSEYLTKNSVNKYILTSNIKKAIKFPSIEKANNVIYSSLPDFIRNKLIEIKPLSEEEPLTDNNEVSYIPFDLEEMKAGISTLEAQMNTIKGNKQYWLNQLSEVDKELSDIEHYIEFTKFSASEGYNLAKSIKECRQRRREIKNNLELISILNLGCCNMISNGTLLNRINSLNDKKYTPRVLTDLFTDVA